MSQPDLVQNYEIVDQRGRANNYFSNYLRSLFRRVTTIQAGTFSSGLDVTGDAVFSGRVTFADDDLTTDALFYADALNATTPALVFDSGDYIAYSRSSDQYNIYIGNNLKVRLNDAGGARFFEAGDTSNEIRILCERDTDTNSVISNTTSKDLEVGMLSGSNTGKLCLVSGGTGDIELDAGGAVRIKNSATPASASATGTAGNVAWDANYIYVCTATDTWKRAALSTW